MTEEHRWELLSQLDEELLQGGVILSEWCTFLTKEAETTFAKGTFLATILTSLAAIETHLRAEEGTSSTRRLVDLIEKSGLEADLVQDLHTLRKYRNRWVHVSDPWDDQVLLENPAQAESELERMALLAVKSMLRTIYSSQWT